MSEENFDVIEIKEDSEQIYTTGVIGGATLFDIRMLLVTDKIVNDENYETNIKRKSEHQIIMTPPVAKMMLDFLQKNLKAFEEEE
jgi:hypothetical protein